MANKKKRRVICCWSLSLVPSVRLVIEIVQQFEFCKMFDYIPMTKNTFMSQLGVQEAQKMFLTETEQMSRKCS